MKRILYFVTLTIIVLSIAEGASAQTTLLDTFSNADSFTISGSTPRTYMGNSFTNNSLAMTTGSFQITNISIFLASAAAASYNDIVARLQFWNTVNSAGTPVFSNAAGSLRTFDLGAASLSANAFYQIDLTLAVPIVLTGGAGHNWGFAINYQGDQGSGLMDNTNLTSLITYSSTGDPYAAGQITNNTSPNYGYYRNASGRTDFNFASTDSRTLGVASQGIAIIISGNELPIPEPSSALLMLGSLPVLGLGLWMRRRAASR